jgi:hypothetical protein
LGASDAVAGAGAEESSGTCSNCESDARLVIFILSCSGSVTPVIYLYLNRIRPERTAWSLGSAIAAPEKLISD